MKKRKLNLKATVLSLGLAVGMMLPASAFAQGVFGDMLDNYYAEKEQPSQGGGALLRGSTRGTIDDNIGDGISNDGFGTTPLGSGIAILIGAGLGYVALKKKED
jgi:hypothetical protein